MRLISCKGNIVISQKRCNGDVVLALSSLGNV